MIKEKLDSCRKAALIKKDLQFQIENLRADARCPGAVRYFDSTPRERGEPISSQQRYIERMEELTALYDEKASKWMKLCRDVESPIAKLPPKLATLCRLRYINGYKWEEINAKMNIPRATSDRWHKKALALLEKNEKST